MTLLSSAIELDFSATAGRARLLVHYDRRRHVLQRGPRAVEHRDLVGPAAPGTSTHDDVGELRVHLLTREKARGQRMLEFADLGTLLEHVDHESRGGDQRGLDLLLPLAVG